MAIVETRQDQDEALERIAPPYLDGDRNNKARVQWALDQFLASVANSANGKAPEPAASGSK